MLHIAVVLSQSAPDPAQDHAKLDGLQHSKQARTAVAVPHKLHFGRLLKLPQLGQEGLQHLVRLGCACKGWQLQEGCMSHRLLACERCSGRTAGHIGCAAGCMPSRVEDGWCSSYLARDDFMCCTPHEQKLGLGQAYPISEKRCAATRLQNPERLLICGLHVCPAHGPVCARS